MAVAAVILAAGQSRRMGRPKPLLSWGKITVLGHLLDQWSSLDAKQIVVVCATGDAAIAAELNRLRWATADRIYNPEPGQGMFSSVQCAARWPEWKADLTHWAIVLGDQPHLRPETLRAVLHLSGRHPEKVCQPAHRGRRGHPVLLPRAVFMKLVGTAAADLKEFLATCDVAVCEVNDPGLNLDIDTSEDYRRALESLKVQKRQRDKTI